MIYVHTQCFARACVSKREIHVLEIIDLIIHKQQIWVISPVKDTFFKKHFY